MSGTFLGAFTNELIRFFEELHETFPEEKEITMGLEAIRGAKKINPKLILDLFFEHVYRDAAQQIMDENEDAVIEYARKKVFSEFNEMSAALLIFDKHWANMSENNQKAIWKYLKVLLVLCAKAKGIQPVKPATA
jgi:DNA repair protein RadC